MGDTAIIVALIAAAVSLINLFLTTSLTQSRERRKALWERELERFLELEEIAGLVVENSLTYKKLTENEEKELHTQMDFLYRASGRFQRYKDVSASVRNLHHAIGLYISQRSSFGSSEEFNQARAEISSSFAKMLETSDKSLSLAHKRL